MYPSPTLEVIGKQWILVLARVETYAMVIGILLGFASGMYFREPGHLAIGAGLGFATALVSGLAYRFVFYNLLTCPACGGRLNRFRNGKRVPGKQAHTQLRNGFGCRHCGWKPSPTGQPTPGSTSGP